ncbi:hypothetical protein F5B22DRAFT_101454 [Xylaria bambusicola]|uniref:uncharacterized protein n=1 Tax=Xylaria bambusicola TaxID=326684 RepID=UPI002007B90B|nr:uncharacterized protein F5B22DRAFT_101454 [Xylaria bambusicola]KAI0517820.1 hypothetical protein F5B22DRAFT_101454 [Xylaria bambusicola]
MELLRKTALSIYDEYENFDASSATELRIARIRANGEDLRAATYEIEDAYEANVVNRISLLSSLGDSEYSESVTASLLLVSMWTSSNGSASEGIGISKPVFLSLIDALGIDRSVLQPIVNNVFGFLEFSETVPTSLGKNTSTYFVANAQMELIWSFNFVTSETKAILINRRGLPHLQCQHRRASVDFLASLRQIRANIFNPYTLLFIFLVRMTTQERKLGTKTWSDARPPDHTAMLEQINSAISSATLGNLTVAARYIEKLTASLSSEERKMDIIDTLLDALSDQTSWEPRFESTPTAKRRLDLCEKDMHVFSAVIRSLRQQSTASRSATKYTTTRAQSQSHLILALRAHEESRLNREMASTHRDLAESAKRDTASMKTIAVMTMAFLPGTFFAALFSVPSLRWDREFVVTERFWVYWVFTLPVTAFVFLIWLVLSYDDGFRTVVEEYQRRKRAEMITD